jgi:hypothetical protein
MSDDRATDRGLGCLLGLAVGDVIGTTLEFSQRESHPPLIDMVGGGPFRLNRVNGRTTQAWRCASPTPDCPAAGSIRET